MNAYTINPLAWEESLNYDGKKIYTATTSRGKYKITESEWLGDPAWYWEYTFCDYYDEDNGYMVNLPLAAAKEHCEQLWTTRMLADLTPTGGGAMNNTKTPCAMYNYRTKIWDYLPETPMDFTDYIPQDPSLLGLYRDLIEMGDTAMESARKVLTACLPKDDLTPTPPAATI